MLIDTVIKNKNVLKYSLVGISLVVSVYGLIFSQPAFLYKGYAKYLEIAEENKEDKFVYVGDTVFKACLNSQHIVRVWYWMKIN